MYPLLLKPLSKDFIWGGNRLKNEFAIEGSERIAEAWMLSVREDSPSIVLNGKYSGLPLSAALKKMGKKAVGKATERFPYFPLLIKLIDAKQPLSIQVHPDDEFALENEGQYGKTEMWYVVDCNKGAKLVYGFNRDIDKIELKQRIKSNTLTEICNYVEVKKGDVFFIPSGMVHAIGEGILIAEVQQNSDCTYRVYDYGRVDSNGNQRDLHIDKALKVATLSKADSNQQQFETSQNDGAKVMTLVSCEYFNVDLIELDGNFEINEKDSFSSVICLDGKCELSWETEKITVKKGMSVFIPALISVNCKGKATLLQSKV